MKRRLVLTALLVMMLTLFAFPMSASAEPDELHVGPGHPYSSIQEAVEAAGEGDTIIVHDTGADPDYEENVNVGVNHLTIKEADGEDVTVKAANPNDHVFDVTADYVTISGLSIYGATDYGKAGIYLGSGINHCTISNNTCYSNSRGIYLDSSSNNAILGNIVSDGGRGIGVWHSDNILIENCVVNDCLVAGISISGSTNAKLRNNSISNTFYDNFDVGGHDISHFYHDIDTSNMVNGKPIYYVIEEKGLVFDGEVMDIGYLGLVSCEDILVKNLSISYNEQGVLLANTSLSKVVDSDFSSNEYGMSLWGCHEVLIENCNMGYNNCGITIRPYVYGSPERSSNNTIRNCNLISNIRGIKVTYSDNLVIENCEVSKCALSISLDYCDNASIKNCTVSGATRRGKYRRDMRWETNYSPAIVTGYSDNVLIENCTTSNNYEFGINLQDSHNAIIKTCIANNNGWGGIRLGNSDNSLIENCKVSNNRCYGISLSGSDSSIIKNCDVENTKFAMRVWKVYGPGYGIKLTGSHNVLIEDCIVESNHYGIHLDGSSNDILSNNILSNNERNFGVWGGDISHFYHDIGTSNLINGKPIYYLIEQKGLTFDGGLNTGYLGLVSCEDILLKNFTMSNNIDGVLFANTPNSRIVNSHFSNNRYGIRLWGSDKVLIENCEIDHNRSTWGWPPRPFGTGMYLSHSSSNLVKNCVFDNNGHGIRLEWSSNVLIESCTFSSNTYYGIWLFSSSNNNRIYHNNFISNDTQAYDECTNYWDKGYPSAGNCWSDYDGADEYWGPDQDQPGSDGIGDTPYEIPGGAGAKDDYPLMEPFKAGDADGDGDVDVFDLVKVKRIILGLDPPTPGADADQDGDVDVFDLVKVKRIILGID